MLVNVLANVIENANVIERWFYMQVWLLRFTTGGYEDYNDTVIGVFTSKEKALAESNRIDDLLHSYGLTGSNHIYGETEAWKQEGLPTVHFYADVLVAGPYELDEIVKYKNGVAI